MTLNTSKCNHLTPLHFKVLKQTALDSLGVRLNVILLKGKCWARLLMVRKGWSYGMIWWKREIMDSWKTSTQTDQDGDMIACENARQKPAGTAETKEEEVYVG